MIGSDCEKFKLFNDYVMDRIEKEWKSETVRYITVKPDDHLETELDSSAYSCFTPRQEMFSVEYDSMMKEIEKGLSRFPKDRPLSLYLNVISESTFFRTNFRYFIYDYPFENYILDRVRKELKSYASISYKKSAMDLKGIIFSATVALKNMHGPKYTSESTRREYVDEFIQLINRSGIKMEGLHLVISMNFYLATACFSIFKRTGETETFEAYVSRRVAEELKDSPIHYVKESFGEKLMLIKIDHGIISNDIEHERKSYVDTVIQRINHLAKIGPAHMSFTLDVKNNDVHLILYRPEKSEDRLKRLEDPVIPCHVDSLKKKPFVVESMDSLEEALKESGLTVNIHPSKPDNIVDELVLSYPIDAKRPRSSYGNLMTNILMGLRREDRFTHAHIDLLRNGSRQFVTVSLYRYASQKNPLSLCITNKDRVRGRSYRDELAIRVDAIKTNRLQRLMDNPGDFKYHALWRSKDEVFESEADEEVKSMMDDMVQQMNQILLSHPKLNAYYVHVNVMPYLTRHVLIEMHVVLCEK